MDVRSNIVLIGATVTGVPTPTANDHAANKAYVDSAVEGLAWKDSARVSTQANISIASPGATIDGITMAANDRVLVRSQTAGAENGIYIWNGAAVPMTRSPDASTADELEQATITVEEGTNAGSTFRQSVVNLTLGTTTVTFTAFGTSAPSASETTAGIIEIATQAEVDAGSGTAFAVTADKLNAWAGRIRRFQANIGDGAATQYDVVHNLGTRDLHVQVFRNATPWDLVIVDTSQPDTNTVRLNFSTAPSSNQFRVVVIR